MQPTDDDTAMVDPFALPMETDGRFAMLILGALMIALYVSFLFLAVAVQFGMTSLVADMPWTLYGFRLLSERLVDHDLFALPDDQIRYLSGAIPPVQMIALLNSLPRLALQSLFFLLIGMAAYAVYRTHPRRIRRQQRLRPLTDFSHPERADDVELSIRRLAAEVRVEPPTTVLLRMGEYNDGQVFGRPGSYLLRLNARPYGKRISALDFLWMRRGREDFRALVLHELGHLANRDVGRSYIAQATWTVFLGLVIGPLLVLSAWLQLMPLAQALWDGPPRGWTWTGVGLWSGQNFGLLLIQIILLILIQRASLAAVWRTREFYADWRVVRWGAGDQLKKMLSAPREQPQTDRSRWVSAQERLPLPLGTLLQRLREWLGREWGVHTSRQERLAQLNDPTRLFDVSPGLAFHTGVLLAFVQVGLTFLALYLGLSLVEILDAAIWSLAGIVIDWPAPLNRIAYLWIMVVLRMVVPGLIASSLLFVTAYLASASLGRQIQRAALIDLIPKAGRPWGYMQLWKPALWLAAGLELGFWVIPMGVFSIRDLPSLMLIPIWIGVFAALTWVWLAYARTLSQRVIGTQGGTRLPKWKRRLVTGCSIVALWMLHLPMLYARNTIMTVGAAGRLSPAFAQQIPNFEGMTRLFGFVVVLLLMLGLVLFAGWALLTLGAAWAWTSRQPRCCPVCSKVPEGVLVVGRRCTACYHHLAPWLYMEPGRRP